MAYKLLQLLEIGFKNLILVRRWVIEVMSFSDTACVIQVILQKFHYGRRKS